MNQKGFLVLESGEIYHGQFHGHYERAGEVVFNTSHSGYEEIATDPSYFSQMVVMTSPMQGNYGVHDRDWESRQFWIEGFISLEVQSEWRERLLNKTIPCFTGLDTRALVMRLRSGGTPWGALVTAESEKQAAERATVLIQEKKKMDRDWVNTVTRSSVERRKGQKDGGAKIAVLDFGAKENILRELAQRAGELILFPSRKKPEDILAVQPDGLMLTNGPGDPADVMIATKTIASLIDRLPIFGICMGHQLLGLSLGGKTYKMKFGHRGSNHPIRDTLLNKIYMTSQNHGYAVEKESLPNDAIVTHTNLNDQTVAGFYSEKRRYLGIQYHPESHPGPHDASGLFDFFFDHMVKKNMTRKV